MAAVPDQSTPADMGPPKKKQRVEHEPELTFLTREMGDLETSLEVDHMILDYLLYNATNACLSSRAPHGAVGDDEVERVLLQADEFLALFKRRYGKYNFDREMRFRQQLLQLVTLFTQRFTQNSTTPSKQSLEALWDRNQARARQWISTLSRLPSAQFDTDAYETAQLPLATQDLENSRARVLATMDISAEDHLYEDAFYGTAAAVSLLDLLPMFMGVSAQCNALYNSNMKEPLMQLAATWMLQACLEQYCVFGASGTDAIDEAFAWGYRSEELDEQGSPGRRTSEGRVAHSLESKHKGEATNAPPQLINNMFRSERNAEVDGWEDIRGATIEELIPDKGKSLATHLMRKAEAHSCGRAEQAFLEYFRALAQCIPKPVLVQLEQGKLDGMDEQETQDFIKGCGVGIMELLA